MEITSDYLKRLTNRTGKPWQGNLKYRDPENPKRFKSLSKVFDRTTVKTKSQATAALKEWRKEVEAEHAAPDARLTVPEYVSHYIEGLASSGAIERSTANNYRFTLKYIEEGFKGVSMRDLQPSTAKEWEDSLTGRGLSPSTVGKAHRLLKQACEHAVELGDLLRNPLDTVKPPKRPRCNANALDEDGRAKAFDMLSRMELKPVSVAAYIALFTGMRRGEICALRWSDVSFERLEITVSRAFGMDNGSAYLKAPKTEKRRVIPIHPQLAFILEAHRTSMKESRNKYCDGLKLTVSEADFAKLYIIGKVDGTPCNPALLGKEWHTLSRIFDLRGIEGKPCTFHDLRHTYATVAVSEGADVKSISSNLGHSSVRVTLDVYASEDPTAKRRTADMVGEALKAVAADVIPFDRTGTDNR